MIDIQITGGTVLLGSDGLQQTDLVLSEGLIGHIGERFGWPAPGCVGPSGASGDRRPAR